MFNPFHVIFGKYGLDDIRIGQWYWQTPHLLSFQTSLQHVTPNDPKAPAECRDGHTMHPRLSWKVSWASSWSPKHFVHPGFAGQGRVAGQCGLWCCDQTQNAGGFAKSDFALRQSLIYHGHAWLPKATTLIFRSCVSTMSRFSEVSVNTWCLLPIRRFICARVLPWCLTSDR